MLNVGQNPRDLSSRVAEPYLHIWRRDDEHVFAFTIITWVKALAVALVCQPGNAIDLSAMSLSANRAFRDAPTSHRHRRILLFL